MMKVYVLPVVHHVLYFWICSISNLVQLLPLSYKGQHNVEENMLQ